MKDPVNQICARIRKVRIEVAGNRGKALFSKQLHLSPSTYDYYESSRIPPADVMIRIADLGKVDLRWLITGQASEQPVSPGHPAVRRVAELLVDRPHAAEPLLAFLDILGQSMAFPPKEHPQAAPVGQAPGGAQPPPAPAQDDSSAGEVFGREGLAGAKESWIPVLGRSAAGVPRFWEDSSQGSGLTLLGDLVRRHAQRRLTEPRTLQSQEPDERDRDVQIITLREPQGEAVEFISCGALKARHGDAFAVRIDGDSMAPDIRHGDLVVLSPSAQAADGKPAVVQIARQIGVTCKLYRREGALVHLIPVNEHFGPQTFEADKVVWALRVLAKIRP